MISSNILFIGFLFIIGSVLWYFTTQEKKIINVVIPESDIKRTDLLYGYFDCLGNQVAETIGHTNLFWSGDNDAPTRFQNIASTKQPTIINLTGQLWQGFPGNFSLKSTAEEELRSYFNQMSQLDILKYVVGLMGVDEPSGNVNPKSDILASNLLIRKVAKDYPELANVKLVATGPETDIYYQYDWIAVYDYKSNNFLVNGTYDGIKSSLHPDQRIILIPGGSFKQDPTSFVNFAQTHSEVVAVVPFKWFEGAGCDGISNNGMADAYISAGKKLCGKL